VKYSRHLLGLVLTSIFSISAVGSLCAQSSLLEANRRLVSTGTPTSPPGAQRPRKISVDAIAAIDLGTAQPVTAYCRTGKFDRVGLRHDQMVDITVQYSTGNAGQAVTVEPLDGGQVIAAAKNLVIAPDGAIHFKFHAGHQPGDYQNVLRNGAQELGLQFWVLDEEHPKNNPAVVNPGN
jgi:hypothetical protein